ncbi:MAG: acetate--CoA ligase family protein [Alphaproteobacteria bacterium]
MVQHRLQPLLAPRSVAIVGASPKQESFGWSSYRALVDYGFEGEVYLINPGYEEIDGRPCYPDLAAIGKPIEHAMLNVANARLEGLFEATIAAGIPAATIFASGYLEGDPDLVTRMRARAAETGLMICGGNGSGFYNRAENVQISLGSGRGDPDIGPITLIAQSGSIYMGMVQTDGRLEFNMTVASGQELATSAADYMDYALELPSTRAIGLFLETVRDPEGFCAAADKARERGVPVIAIKTARTALSKRMAVSHSGALAGDDAVYDAVFERHSVVRVREVDELIATLQLATQPRVMVPGGLVAITDSGGEREHLADLADDAGVPFAQISEATTARLAERLDYGLDPVNPLDAWGTGHDYLNIFLDCWRALMADDDCAVGIWVADLRDGEKYRTPFQKGAKAIAEETGKPMVFATCVPNAIVHETARALYQDGIPLIDGLDNAVIAVARLMAWRDHRPASAMTPPNAPDNAVVEPWRQRLATGEALSEIEGLALARDFGIAVPNPVIAEDAEGAVQAARAMAGPVVLKTAMPGIAHKSDVGGVHLSLGDDDAVRAAWQDMADRLGPRCLVAPMAPTGTEMVFGLVNDPQFGPMVLIGTGGIFVEVLGDSVLAKPPFDAMCARGLIDRLQGRALLDGVRGKPAADLDALAQTLARFSVLAATLGAAIDELDLNPVIAGPDGAVAVDALVVPSTNP